MSATTIPTTFSDLYTDLENRTKTQTGVTATENQAKRYINIALLDMHIGSWERFSWAERRTNLVTQAEYNTGTVTITKGSTTLTGASTAWNTNNSFSIANMRVGGKVVIAGTPEVYEVSAVGSDTSATLTSAFIDTDVSAETYNYFEDEYALASDFLRPIDAQFLDMNREIVLIGRREFRDLYPRNKVTGKPRIATIIDLPPSGSVTPVRKVRLHQPPDTVYMIPYHYVTSNLAVSSSGTAQAALSADADEPIVPRQYRHVLVFHALYHWYRDQRDDSRAGAAKEEYETLLTRIIQDEEIGAPTPRFRPRLGPYARAASRPWSGGGTRYVTGTAFDELRDR